MKLLTIGQLAKKAGVATSLLRYYESTGLLVPAGRTDAGYRLYAPEAEQDLRFIQRAQRLGFSLADIRRFMDGLNGAGLDDATVAETAERRYVEIERQLTELRVLQHELETFLLDFRHRMQQQGEEPGAGLYDQLVARVCDHGDHRQHPGASSLAWLMQRIGCSLATVNQPAILDVLRGRHVHVWREGDAYRILVPGHGEDLQTALEEIARIERDCHAHSAPVLERVDEGYIFVISGEQAFLFVQFFLALETDLPPK